ncbi:MAG: hypothetical protein WAX04_07145 [Oscillospiraceae bacterium]
MISIEVKDKNLVIENQIISWKQAINRVCFYGPLNIVPQIEDICREILTTWALNNGATLMRSDIMLDYIKLISIKSRFDYEDLPICKFGQFIFMYCFPVFEKVKADADKNGCYPNDFWAIKRLWNHSRGVGCPAFTFCIGSPSELFNDFPFSAATHIYLEDCITNPNNVKVKRCY